MLDDRLYLRPASMEDAGLLYVWRNETECRRNSVNTGYIEYDSHCKWLSGRLSSGCCSIFICMREHGGGYEPVGQARVGYNMARCGEISYSIDAAYRCNGYGTRMLGLLEEMEEIKRNNDENYTFVKWDTIDEKINMLKQKREEIWQK